MSILLFKDWSYRFCFICAFGIFSCPLAGQESVVLDLYIELALSSSLTMKQIELQEIQQHARVDQAKRRWQPNVDLTTTYLLAKGGRRILFPIGDLFNPAYGALNQLTGTEQFPTDLENLETQLTPNNFIDAGITISRPILNSAIKYNVKIQEALLLLHNVDREVQSKEVTFQTKQAYYNYLKADQGARIIDQNMTLLQEVLEFNKKLIKYDKATPDALSDIHFQIASLEGQRQRLQEQKSLSQTILNTIMHRDIDMEISVDTTLLKEHERILKPLDYLIDQALRNRPELKKIDLGMHVQDIDQKRVRSSNHPTLAAQGGIGVQAEEFSFDESGPLYTFGLNVGWKIWDGGLRKKQLEEMSIQKEETQLERTLTEERITLQVAQAYHQLQMLYAQQDQEEAAIYASKTSYQAINSRYRNDKALLIELLTAQNRWSASKLNKILVGIDILIAEANLKRIIHE